MHKVIAGLAAVALVVGVILVLQPFPSAQAQETEERVFRGPLRTVLDDLVEEDVITEEQADRITSEFEERFEFRFGRRGTPHLETAAEVIGIDIDDLVDQLREGASLADIAEANGSSAEAVVDALVADHEARLEAAVEAGRLSREEAEEIRAATAERIEAMVNGECAPGLRHRVFEGPGFFGPGHGYRGSHHHMWPHTEDTTGTGTSA